MMDKKHCVGCRENFYNGNNSLGIQECWMLKSAKLILRKAVHRDQRAPWNQTATEKPSCYRSQDYIYVGPEVTR
jgi:hypothetical protein